MSDADLVLNPIAAVAKALRRAAEGKAAAQAEAAEWKRKFELERARNLHLECKGSLLNDMPQLAPTCRFALLNTLVWSRMIKEIHFLNVCEQISAVKLLSIQDNFFIL